MSAPLFQLQVVPRYQGKRLLRRLLLTIPLTSFILFVSLFLAFQHKPGWYRPVIIDVADEAKLQAVRREASNRFDEFGDALVLGKPFEEVISDTALNNLLATLPELWPEAATWLPREFAEPAVSFDEGRIRVGAILSASDWKFVAGLTPSISVEPDLSTLRVSLSGISGGSLPIPRSIIERALGESLSPKNVGTNTSNRGSASANAPISSARDIQSPQQLFSGVLVRNQFVWPNGQRKFRIRSIAVHDGEIRLGIDPQ